MMAMSSDQGERRGFFCCGDAVGYLLRKSWILWQQRKLATTFAHHFELNIDALTPSSGTSLDLKLTGTPDE
jgi:hypothetical protein